MVQIKWLKDAKYDLQEIYDYISKDSERYAERQVERILERTWVLKKQIESGKQVEEINRKDIRELIEGRYRIIYRIVSKTMVHILMIHHSSRDLSRRIRND
jgi:addiction module RelE/StbE family toxin